MKAREKKAETTRETPKAPKGGSRTWMILVAVALAWFLLDFGGDDDPTAGHYGFRGQMHDVDYGSRPSRLTAGQIHQQQAHWLQQQLQGAVALRRMQLAQQQRMMMQGGGSTIHRGLGGTYGTDGNDFYISFGDGSSYLGSR